MDLNKRFFHQIENLKSVFDTIHPYFIQQKPIDRHLTLFFRKNSRFGSRDRRFISNSIFGYYRWYGWLNQLGMENISKALLFGYLLDGNEINDLIFFWAHQCNVNTVLVRKSQETENVKEKIAIMSSILPGCNLSSLNPELCKKWPESLVNAFQNRPALWVRTNNSHNQRFISFLESKNVAYRKHPTSGTSLEILSTVNLYESEDFQKGRLEVQDISSQGVGFICNPKAGETWWDVCAGSGGKSLHLASLMKGTGKIYATEIFQDRLKELKKRIKRNKKTRNILPGLWDGKSIPEFREPLSGVLVDAPCSCSGTWRRAPDLRWHITAEKIAYYSNIQFDILSLVSAKVGKQGVLIYATCSLFTEENEQVIDRFLNVNPDFSLHPLTCPFLNRKVKGALNFQPPEVDGNSMFVARMIRQ